MSSRAKMAAAAAIQKIQFVSYNSIKARKKPCLSGGQEHEPQD
jgi:hypothetical protein